MGDFKLNRQLTVTKIEALVDKVDKQINLSKTRIVTTCKEELARLLTKFETLHIQTVSKEGSGLDDEGNKTLFTSVTSLVDDAIDRADEYLHNEAAVEMSEKVERRYEVLEATYNDIVAELEQLEESLSWMKQAKDGDFRTDLLVATAGIASSDKKMETIKQMEEFILTNEKSSEKRKSLLEDINRKYANIRRLHMRLKSAVNRSSAAGSIQVSRANSPERGRPPDKEKGKPPENEFAGFSDSDSDEGREFEGFRSSERDRAVEKPSVNFGFLMDKEAVNPQDAGEASASDAEANTNVTRKEQPLSSQQMPQMPSYQPRINQSASRSSSASRTTSSAASSMFKPKKMEYPKFGGGIRAYNTFRRDFHMIIEDSGAFSESQMSLLLRNECLQGAPKSLVHNIYEYTDIWEKLNEMYDDEAQVVQIITKQLMSFKEIQEDDMDGFIDFVDTIEKAYYDLRAYKSTDVLSNTMTVQTIMEKCPAWVQQTLTRDLTKKNIPRELEFEYIRKGLVELKKQARKLAKLNDKKKQKGGGSSQGGRGGSKCGRGGGAATSSSACGCCSQCCILSGSTVLTTEPII